MHSLQRLAASGGLGAERLAASVLGCGGSRLRGLATTPAALQGKPEPVPDPLDLEFDRSDDVAFAQARDAEYEASQRILREEGLKVPVDLECEFDRDDPNAVSPEELYAERAAPEPLAAVDLDTELDMDDPLLADKSHLWDVPEPPQPADIDGEMDLMADREEGDRAYGGMAESNRDAPGGTMAGNPNAPFGQGVRRAADAPDPRIGQYREKAAA